MSATRLNLKRRRVDHDQLVAHIDVTFGVNKDTRIFFIGTQATSVFTADTTTTLNLRATRGWASWDCRLPEQRPISTRTWRWSDRHDGRRRHIRLCRASASIRPRARARSPRPSCSSDRCRTSCMPISAARRGDAADYRIGWRLLEERHAGGHVGRCQAAFDTRPGYVANSGHAPLPVDHARHGAGGDQAPPSCCGKLPAAEAAKNLPVIGTNVQGWSH